MASAQAIGVLGTEDLVFRALSPASLTEFSSLKFFGLKKKKKVGLASPASGPRERRWGLLVKICQSQWFCFGLP